MLRLVLKYEYTLFFHSRCKGRSRTPFVKRGDFKNFWISQVFFLYLCRHASKNCLRFPNSLILMTSLLSRLKNPRTRAICSFYYFFYSGGRFPFRHGFATDWVKKMKIFENFYTIRSDIQQCIKNRKLVLIRWLISSDLVLERKSFPPIDNMWLNWILNYIRCVV